MEHQLTVIYHRSDYDGIFCYQIAYKFFGQNARYIGWDYIDPKLEFPETGSVYVMDLSPDCFRATLEPYQMQRVVWIDHHRSAIEKFNPHYFGYRIDGVAASRLAWQWFFHPEGPMNHNLQEYDYRLPEKAEFINRQVSEPIAVRLVGEYDVWDHRDQQEDVAFQFGLDSQQELEWTSLLQISNPGSNAMRGESSTDYVARIIKDGRAAMQCYAKRDADIMLSRSFIAVFEGLTFLVLNTARCNSQTFSARDIEALGHDALMAFYYTGEKWSVSMYHAAHRKDLDLSKIAVKHGGGGHPGACGFMAKKLPFLPC